MKNKILLFLLLGAYTIIFAQSGLSKTADGQFLADNHAAKLKVVDAVSAFNHNLPFKNSSDYEKKTASQVNKSFIEGQNSLSFNPSPIFAEIPLLKPDESMNYNGYYKVWITGDDRYNAIPNGKLLIITGIYPNAELVQKGNIFAGRDLVYSIRIELLRDKFMPVFQSRLEIKGSTLQNTPLVAGQSPLFILRPGQYLYIHNSENSETAVELHIRGFLVDEKYQFKF